MKFEWRKFSRWPLVLFFLTWVILGGYPVWQTQETQANLDQRKQTFLLENKEMLTTAYDVMKQENAPDFLLQNMQKKFFALEKIEKGLKEKNSQKQLLGERDWLMIQLEETKNGNLVGRTLPELELEMAEYNFFIKEEKKRVDPFYTAEIPAPNQFVQRLQEFSYPLLLSFLTGMIALFLSYEQRMKTQFLRVLPQKVTHIWAKKQLLLFGVLTGFLLLGLGSLYAAIWIKNGGTDFSYPLFYLDAQKEVQQTTLGVYVGLFFFSSLCWLFFLISFGRFLQRVTQQFLLTWLGLELCLIPLAFNQMGTLLPEKIAPYLLVSYLDFPRLLIGQNPWGHPTITWQKGILCLLFFGLFFLLINRQMSQRQSQALRKEVSIK